METELKSRKFLPKNLPLSSGLDVLPYDWKSFKDSIELKDFCGLR